MAYGEVVIVSGTRRDSEELQKAIQQVLSLVHQCNGHSVVLFHGAATGADSAAEAYAQKAKWQTYPMPYLKVAGKAGGPIRNEMMIGAARELGLMLNWPVQLYAFPDALSKGTLHCIKEAQTRGIVVIRSLIGAVPA